jgi:hypothetical protein
MREEKARGKRGHGVTILKRNGTRNSSEGDVIKTSADR